jgi:hypothetical protein
MSHHHNTLQQYDIKTANRFFKNLAWLKYLGMTVTHQNLTEEEIKGRINSGNVCCH